MKRILLLHGYGQTATIFYTKACLPQRRRSVKYTDTSRWQQSASNAVKTVNSPQVFVDAPMALKPADLPQNLSSIGAERAATGISTNSDAEELAARGWWLRNNPETMERCITYLRDLVSNQEIPYDGVFGFSQGACAAALLTSMLEHPGAVPSFNSDGEAPHPPLKFCIAVAGFRPTAPSIDALMEQGITTPTLLVMGENDQIVGSKRSQTLADVCSGARVEKHEGGKYQPAEFGHFIPSKATWRQFFANYIKLEDHSMSSAIPSPNPLLTGSGASTPVISRPPSR